MITGTNLFCGHFTTVNVAINKKSMMCFSSIMRKMLLLANCCDIIGIKYGDML